MTGLKNILYKNYIGSCPRADFDHSKDTKEINKIHKKSSRIFLDKLINGEISPEATFHDDPSHYSLSNGVLAYIINYIPLKDLLEAQEIFKKHHNLPIVESMMLHVITTRTVVQAAEKLDFLLECGVPANLFFGAKHQHFYKSFNKTACELTSDPAFLSVLKKHGANPHLKPQKSDVEVYIDLSKNLLKKGIPVAYAEKDVSFSFLQHFIMYEVYANKPIRCHLNSSLNNVPLDIDIKLKNHIENLEFTKESSIRNGYKSYQSAFEFAEDKKDFKKVKMLNDIFGNAQKDKEDLENYQSIVKFLDEKNLKAAIKLTRKAMAFDNENLYQNLHQHLNLFDIPQKEGTYKNLLLWSVDLKNMRYTKKIMDLNEEHKLIDKQKTNTSEQTYIGYCIAKGLSKFAILFLERGYYAENEKLAAEGYVRNNIDKALNHGLTSLAFKMYELGFIYNEKHSKVKSMIKNERKMLKAKVIGDEVKERKAVKVL